MTVFSILLIGLTAWMMPTLVPRSVPFGVRIPAARAKEPVIARQRRLYRYGIAAVTLVVAAVLLATGDRPPLGGLGVPAELAGAFALFQVARRRIMAVKQREHWFGGLRQAVVADTSLRTDPEPFPCIPEQSQVMSWSGHSQIGQSLIPVRLSRATAATPGLVTGQASRSAG